VLWQKSELFLRAIHDHLVVPQQQPQHLHGPSYTNANDNNADTTTRTAPPFRVLHSIAASWPYPKQMLRIGMILLQGKGNKDNNNNNNSDGIVDMVRERDEQGRLPLHVLVSSYAAYHHHNNNKSSFLHDHDRDDDKQHIRNSTHTHTHTNIAADYNNHHHLHSTCGSIVDEVEHLLKSYPDAASVRDHGGNLALTLAIGGGMLWCDGIESIVRAYPDALRMRCCSHVVVDDVDDEDGDCNTCNGLFPFQMAACQPICTIVDQQQDDDANDGLLSAVDINMAQWGHHRADNVDVLQLRTIFELLRLCPDVVA